MDIDCDSEVPLAEDTVGDDEDEGNETSLLFCSPQVLQNGETLSSLVAGNRRISRVL